MELCSTTVGAFQVSRVPYLPQQQDMKLFKQAISIRAGNKTTLVNKISSSRFGFRSTPLIISNRLKKKQQQQQQRNVWWSSSSAFSEVESSMEDYARTLETECGHMIMPPTHPTRIRIESILVEIIDALNVGLNLKHKCTVSGRDVSSRSSSSCNRREELSQAMMKKLGMAYGTEHLEERNWELMLLDCDFWDKNIAALYLIGLGKIVMSAKAMEEDTSDSRIAFVLGHEVGHGVTLDSKKDLMTWVALTTRVWPVRPILPSINIVADVLRHHLGNWFSRRMELKARYVSIMLMASAGYDPRAVAGKIGRPKSSPKHSIFTATHPCREKTSKYLRKTILEEAIFVYQQLHEEDPPTTLGADGKKTSHCSLWKRLYNTLFRSLNLNSD